jgi:hypothetical protein
MTQTDAAERRWQSLAELHEIPVPPLRTGDRMTRAEYAAVYEPLPTDFRAQLIEGVVYLSGPVKFIHGQATAHLAGWAGMYRGWTPGVTGSLHVTTRLDPMNEPEPDVSLLIDAASGGQTFVSPDDFLVGPAEWIGEVVESRDAAEYGPKMAAYARNGVREYVVWCLEDDSIEWFSLRGGRYEPLSPDGAGIIRSEVLPGLWLDVTAMLNDNFPRLWDVLQQSLASPEHAAFVAALQARATPST